MPLPPPPHPALPPPQADYALDQVEEVAEINRTAARLAKKATAAYMAAHPGSVKFVAGAIGPTNKTLSVSPSVENPALRGITYDEVEQAYYEQAKALWEGGVDMFLVETIFDTGNAKAAIYALERFFEEQARCRCCCCWGAVGALLLLLLGCCWAAAGRRRGRHCRLPTRRCRRLHAGDPCRAPWPPPACPCSACASPCSSAAPSWTTLGAR